MDEVRNAGQHLDGVQTQRVAPMWTRGLPRDLFFRQRERVFEYERGGPSLQPHVVVLHVSQT
jgi:hypothetical protein